MGESTRPPKSSSKAPVYMTEPKLAGDIDITMQTLLNTDTIDKAKDKARFEQYMVKDRLQLGRLWLNYAKYKDLKKEAWRLKLLEGEDEASNVEAPQDEVEAPQVEAPQNESESDDERDARSTDGSDEGSDLGSFFDDEEVEDPPTPPKRKVPIPTRVQPKRSTRKETVVESGESELESDEEAPKKGKEPKVPPSPKSKEPKAPKKSKEPKKSKNVDRPGDADGDDYDSDVEVLGGEEKEAEQVNLMDTVLAQYEELKETNDLSVGSLEQNYPGLDESPELAKAISYLINRSKKYTNPPSGPNAKKYLVLYSILTYANLLRNKLEVGRVEPKDSEFNNHFKEERLQPFRYQSIYDEGRLNFQYEDVDPTAQKGFAEVHGREEQTYAVNGKTSQVVKGYEAELGHAKDGVGIAYQRRAIPHGIPAYSCNLLFAQRHRHKEGEL